MGIRINSHYECPYEYKEPDYIPLEPLDNFKIDFDLDLSNEGIDEKNIFLNKDIYFLCKKYDIISENIVYYLKYRSKIKRKEAFKAFFTNDNALLMINDLDRSIEEVTEFMCFVHGMVREYYNCLYVLVGSKIDPLIVLKASEFMPFRRVFFYTDNYDLLRDLFKLWSEREYGPAMIEPFVWICSNKREIESNVFKDYVEIAKILNSNEINSQLENKLNLKNVKEYVFKLLKEYKKLIPKDRRYYSPALYLSSTFL